MSINRRKLIASSVITAGVTVLGASALAQQKTIKIGFIGPISGGNASHGMAARNGFLLAVEQANASGLPFKIEPVVLDDASDPTAGVNAALKLVNDPDVVAAIGHYNSPVALATTPVFERARVPFIIWGAISPRITEQKQQFVTRVTPTLTAENAPLAEWLAKTKKVKTLVLLSDTSDYGKQNTISFTQLFERHGGKIVSSDAAPVGTTDFRAILTKLKAQNAEGLYFGGVVTEAGIVSKQMKDIGLNIPMYGISGLYDPKFIDIAGPAGEGTVAGVRQEQENPKSVAMRAAYAAHKFNEPLTGYSLLAFDAVGVIAEVLRQQGPANKEAIAKAIRAIKYNGVLGDTSFDANGQTQVSMAISQFVVRDGKWVKM